MSELSQQAKNRRGPPWEGLKKAALTPFSKRNRRVSEMALREDEPLPATLTFVLVMGAVFAVLWFLMFVLLKSRW